MFCQSPGWVRKQDQGQCQACGHTSHTTSDNDGEILGLKIQLYIFRAFAEGKGICFLLSVHWMSQSAWCLLCTYWQAKFAEAKVWGKKIRLKMTAPNFWVCSKIRCMWLQIEIFCISHALNTFQCWLGWWQSCARWSTTFLQFPVYPVWLLAVWLLAVWGYPVW